jgi:hypothetical protein
LKWQRREKREDERVMPVLVLTLILIPEATAIRDFVDSIVLRRRVNI